MIDLRSDTVTTPGESMRAAAADADGGDGGYEEDPTVAELESRAAEVTGFEDALFVPSGTMGNQIAVRVHTERGQEVLIEEQSHVYKWELGGLAQHSQVQTRTVDGGERGIPSPAAIRAGYVEEDLHRPGTGLLTLENSHNSRGGIAIAPEAIDAAAETAGELGVPVHLDGARLFNAATHHDVPAERITRNVDSVMFCLSKGLGAPIGSMLAGSESFIAEARRVRKLFGGGMRQAGIIAAPGLEALANRERLHEDHENARLLAEELAGVEGLDVQMPETNIVLVGTSGLGLSAAAFCSALEARGVRASEFGETTVRFCTHLDIDREAIETAVGVVEDVTAAT